ncbi:MAG: alpha/beta hydrolase, partial [Myxococcota bacterium]
HTQGLLPNHGHDWGAILGYGVAAQAPERLLSLTAMAVPLPRGMVKARSRGWVQLRRSWYIAFFVALGRFADAHVEANDWAFIERLWRTWSPAYVCPSGEMRLIKDTLGAPGVKAAALGYYRDAFELMGPRTQRAYTLFSARLQVPTLALNGSQDGCVDPLFFTLSMEQEDTLAELKLKTIPGAGHFLHLEAPKVVNRILGAWLEQHHAR